MNRKGMMARIRSAISTKNTPEENRAAAVAARLAHPPKHPKPAFAMLQGPASEERLVQALENQGARIVKVAGLDEVPAAVETLLAGSNPIPRLVVGDDERLTTLSWPNTRPYDVWKLDDMLGDGTAAVTHAWGAVAETGTLVMTSSPQSPTSLAFLPEHHIIALARKDILASFEDAFARLTSEAGPGRLPRAVNLISSPSRTSDIGGRSVRGAHGPRHLAVILYGPPL